MATRPRRQINIAEEMAEMPISLDSVNDLGERRSIKSMINIMQID